MSALDHLEIGTLSFERCHGAMVLDPAERVRLILAAAEGYEPDLLVTSGHAVDSLDDLNRLADQYRLLECCGTIITEVLHDTPAGAEHESHAMWAVMNDGRMHRFGLQAFGRSREVLEPGSEHLVRFEHDLDGRTLALADGNVFALICGEINVVHGRTSPRYLSNRAETAIIAADVVINPTHDRMSNAGTLAAKRCFLSRASEDGRNRVYVSCSNWEACGNEEGRTQQPSPTLHTVYVSEDPQTFEEKADGTFGFVYRHWALDL